MTTTTRTKRYRYAPPFNPMDPVAPSCELCDWGFSPIHEPDLAQHDIDHGRLLEMERWTGRLMGKLERRQIEHRVDAILRKSQSLEERVAAALEVAKAFHDRHHRRVAKAGIVDQRCLFEDFVAAADLEHSFPADVVAELRKKYEPLNWPEIRWKWEYRD